MRANGVRSLDVSCWLGHRQTILSADPWPDHMPVPAFGPRMVCHYNGRVALRPPHRAGQAHCGRHDLGECGPPASTKPGQLRLRPNVCRN
jgi:hypothetical protein